MTGTVVSRDPLEQEIIELRSSPADGTLFGKTVSRVAIRHLRGTTATIALLGA